MVKKKKKKKKNIFLRILFWIIGIIVCLVLFLLIANAISTIRDLNYVDKIKPVEYDTKAQLIPLLDEETGFYTFTTNRQFKIMQLTDIHIGAGFLSVKNDKQAIKAVETMVRREKPDLVVVTGDAFFPVPQSGTFNNSHELRVFATMMNNLGVYWAYTFGNHEYQGFSFLSEAKLAEKLEGCSEYCLFQRGSEKVSGEGNYIINVKNTDGVITRSVVCLDSHAYMPEDKLGLDEKYDNIHSDQIEWYRNTLNSLDESNRHTIASLQDGAKRSKYTNDFSIIKSFVFFHIPLKEYRTAWNNYKANHYRSKGDTTYIYGYMGEKKPPYIYCSEKDENLFETAQALGSTQGFFCGHDHTNNFSFVYKGIRLTYGYSIDSLVYKNIKNLGSQRGCTLIYSMPNGKFRIIGENYYQKKYDFEGKEKVTMQHLNAEQEKAQKNGK